MLTEAIVRAAAPATLANYTQPALVVPRLLERDTAGIIGELARLLQCHGFVPDLLPFYHAALNQELLANSALPCGLAFPHARLSGLKRLQFAFGVAAHPVLWGASGSAPVQLVFLLAVPATDAVNYLHLLASLAKLGQRPELLAQLLQADCPHAVLAVLDQIKIRQG